MSRKSRAQRARERPCPMCWGSHGCRKQAGHSGNHFCSKSCPVVPEDAVIGPITYGSGMATWNEETNDWLRVGDKRSRCSNCGELMSSSMTSVGHLGYSGNLRGWLGCKKPVDA